MTTCEKAQIDNFEVSKKVVGRTDNGIYETF